MKLIKKCLDPSFWLAKNTEYKIENKIKPSIGKKIKRIVSLALGSEIYYARLLDPRYKIKIDFFKNSNIAISSLSRKGYSDEQITSASFELLVSNYPSEIL